MSNITVYKFVKKFRQTSKQLLRKLQKTLGATFFAAPCSYTSSKIQYKLQDNRTLLL